MFFIIKRQAHGHNALRVLSGGDGKILSSLVPTVSQQHFAGGFCGRDATNLRGPVYGATLFASLQARLKEVPGRARRSQRSINHMSVGSFVDSPLSIAAV
jgi:hypothetical protein